MLPIFDIKQNIQTTYPGVMFKTCTDIQMKWNTIHNYKYDI